MIKPISQIGVCNPVQCKKVIATRIERSKETEALETGTHDSTLTLRDRELIWTKDKKNYCLDDA